MYRRIGKKEHLTGGVVCERREIPEGSLVLNSEWKRTSNRRKRERERAGQCLPFRLLYLSLSLFFSFDDDDTGDRQTQKFATFSYSLLSSDFSNLQPKTRCCPSLLLVDLSRLPGMVDGAWDRLDWAVIGLTNLTSFFLIFSYPFWLIHSPYTPHAPHVLFRIFPARSARSSFFQEPVASPTPSVPITFFSFPGSRAPCG